MSNSTNIFFNKAIELLHQKSFDTYRVSLHNPYTVFHELERSIEKFNKKKIKNFDPTISSIGEEAKFQLENPQLSDLIDFGSFSNKHVCDVLEKTCIKNKDGKLNRTLTMLSKTILYQNKNFEDKLFLKLKELILEDNDTQLSIIEQYTSWLISQLLYCGFSRKFIVYQLRQCANDIKMNASLEATLDKLESTFKNGSDSHEVIFKMKKKTTTPLKSASFAITELFAFPAEFTNANFINDKFKTKDPNEVYVSIKVIGCDFWAALKSAYQIITETVEINILNRSENKITIEGQALVIHEESRRYRMDTIEEAIDGFYEYKEDGFDRFIENFKKIRPDSVAREKLRSAIRFYKLGNDSIELEHKILNYWIGFEQLFSSVEGNEDSIKRIKAFFISISTAYYMQRRTNYLLDSLARSGINLNGSPVVLSDLIEANNMVFTQGNNILIFKRLQHYIKFLNTKKELSSVLYAHINRLDQHLTRIYKVRNEIVHEGRTELDLRLIAGHLRHYLLFSIEQINNELNENDTLELLDDVFVFFENIKERVITSNNINEIFAIKNYSGYME